MIRYIVVTLFTVLSWPISLDAVEIKGIVRDVDGNGLSGASIRVYYRDPEGVLRRKQVKSKQADPAEKTPVGHYKVEIPSDNTETIQAIEYDHPNWHSGIVNNISRQSTHDGEINIALLLEDGPKSFALILRQIRDYEAIYYVEEEYLSTLGSDETLAALEEAPATRYYERISRLPNPRFEYSDEDLQKEIVKALHDKQLITIRRELDELYDLYDMEKPTKVVCVKRCMAVRGCFGQTRYVWKTYLEKRPLPFNSYNKMFEKK